ncbi:MAG: class II aldolase/adducin family protein [bacterium]
MEYFEDRILIATYMKRLYKMGLTTSTGGNISRRVSDDFLLITPSQKDKSALKPYDICVANFKGENLTPKFKCSMELGMHIAIYKQREDINSICHAHPTFASTYSFTNKDINSSLSGEMRAICGEITKAEYALMGTNELADNVAEKVRKSNVVLLENHGALTLGTNLCQAFERMEILEKIAKSNFLLNILKGTKNLPAKDIDEIDELFGNRF